MKYLRLFLALFNCITLGRLIVQDAPIAIIGIVIFMIIFFFGAFLYENERDFKNHNVQNENGDFNRNNIIL